MMVRSVVSVLAAAVIVPSAMAAATGADVQRRIDADLADGKPIVVHVVVALCDNANQGIVPVPKALGNGQQPGTNLYWGALYGLRTYLTREAGWVVQNLSGSTPEFPVLDRVVLTAEIERKSRTVPVRIVAEAWDGAKIRGAIQAYLDMAAGNEDPAHVVVFIGHNGLMDFAVEPPARQPGRVPPRSAIVLACASKSYFSDHLRAAGAHPLLLTTGLMAPEAYTLDAAIRAWVAEGTTAAVTEAAAVAYDRYQKCGLSAARGLFWGAP